MTEKKFSFILNPISGLKRNKRSVVDLIHQYFSSQQKIEYSINFTQYPGHAHELAHEAVNNGFDVVVAVGGDGTMNEVASALVHSDTALGLLPRGSGNGYARSLGIPLNIEAALKTLIEGKIRRVDVGKVDNYFFFGVVGMGFDAHIGAQFQEFGLRGPLPYFYIGIREFFRYKYEAFTIRFDGKEMATRPLLVTVANTPQYGMNAMIAPGASFDDGLLEICILEKMTTFQVVSRLHRLFNGSIQSIPYYRRFSCRQVTIEREYEQGVFHTDGEPRMSGKELHISILPAALKVVVPKRTK